MDADTQDGLGGARVSFERAWRQTPPKRAAEVTRAVAVRAARGHVEGDPEPGYWSAGPRAPDNVWRELERQTDPAIDLTGTKKRVSYGTISDLLVWDLRDHDVRIALGLSWEQVIGDDWTPVQRVAQRAREAGMEGLVIPSAVEPNEHVTIVVFRSAIPFRYLPGGWDDEVYWPGPSIDEDAA